MKKNLTEVISVLDESGSMAMLVNDTVIGYNTFIQEQKEIEGECKVTLVTFSTASKVIDNGKDIKEAIILEARGNYYPSGGTALYDAVCLAIDTVGKRLNETPEDERPENVVFVINTDGEENSSREYGLKDMVDRIETQQTKYNWKFLFFGTNFDALKTGSSYGIGASKGFTNSGVGLQSTYSATSCVMRSLRTGDARDYSEIVLDAMSEVK